MSEKHFHAALIDVDNVLDAKYLRRVAAALEKQVYEHFAPAWGVTATVTVGIQGDEHPLRIEVWNRAETAKAGYHLWNEKGQPLRPYTIVNLKDLPDEAMWPRVASHELLEMLADPFGNRTITAPDPEGKPGTVRYIVEVGDPCNLDSYTPDGYPDVPVSDFVLPSYYHVGKPGPYSHKATIGGPLEVNKGGYVSFIRGTKPHLKLYWKIFRANSAGAVIEPVDPKVLTGSCLREDIDAIARTELL